MSACKQIPHPVLTKLHTTPIRNFKDDEDLQLVDEYFQNWSFTHVLSVSPSYMWYFAKDQESWPKSWPILHHIKILDDYDILLKLPEAYKFIEKAMDHYADMRVLVACTESQATESGVCPLCTS
jgi:hypothetical protein